MKSNVEVKERIQKLWNVINDNKLLPREEAQIKAVIAELYWVVDEPYYDVARVA